MTDKDLLQVLVDSQKDTNALMHSITKRWTIIVIAVSLSVVLAMACMSLTVASMVKTYFITDYAYPTLEQNVTQEVEQKIDMKGDN